MNIIILGAGKVGTALAQKLTEEKHSVTVIDISRERLDNLTEFYDIMGIEGNGTSVEVLKEAGIETADLFVSVTGTDEINLLCCMFARKAGKCKVIARVRNPDYNAEINFIQNQLGISSIINTDLATAKEIQKLLMFPAAHKIESFVNDKVRLIRFELNDFSLLKGASLKEIAERIDSDVLICCVERGNTITIPDGNFVLHNGDMVSFLATTENAKKFFKAIGLKNKPARNALIVGGGTLGYYLAKSLIKNGVDVRIIELDEKRCDDLIEKLPEATIIKGDATNRRLLLSEGLEMTDAFVSLTGMDEENMMLGLYARQHSKAKIITKVNRFEFDDILSELDIGSVVFPKYIITDHILQYVRAFKTKGGSALKTLYNILDDRVEALEFSITEKASFTDVPLYKLKFKPNQLICCISRGGEIIIPRGGDVIKVGDSVILVTLRHGLDSFSDALE